jgi:tRNA uridine 5-carboxymethylaminomethyl modification enzyme
MRRVGEKVRCTQKLSTIVNDTPVTPSEANALLERLNTPSLQQRVRLVNLLLRPEITMAGLVEISPSLRTSVLEIPEEVRQHAVNATEILLKYQRYIEKEQDVANRILKFEDIALPNDFDYFSLQSLSYEAREKLTKMHPSTIGQASRISGVSPADVSVLLIAVTHKSSNPGN